MKIHLRQRKQSKKGKISLYLEYYKGTVTNSDGKVKPIREYEYLDLYLIDKPKTQTDKESNKKTLELAESIKAKRLIDIKNGQHGFSSNVKQNTNFIEYFEKQLQKKSQSQGNYGNWESTLKHLIKFAGEKVAFKDIDTTFCEGFKKHLQTAKTQSNKNLASSTVASYFTKFRTCLKDAVKDKIILSNPCIDVSTPRTIENKREYLTLDELKNAAKTECRYEVLKRAFLFSCLTGLRWSDIQTLKWSEVQKTDDGYRVVFNQQKTKGLQYLDISDQARAYLGEKDSPDDRVFTGLKYSSYTNIALLQWMLSAGISKHITFHSGRHTFAVLQLTLGTDIYTLSKLLGHTDIKTTEIYADIIDENKRVAANKIPDINI